MGIGLEQQGDAPDACQCDHGVDDACQQHVRTATDPSHQIKLEQPDASPVKGADNRDKQR